MNLQRHFQIFIFVTISINSNYQHSLKWMKHRNHTTEIFRPFHVHYTKVQRVNNLNVSLTRSISEVASTNYSLFVTFFIWTLQSCNNSRLRRNFHLFAVCTRILLIHSYWDFFSCNFQWYFLHIVTLRNLTIFFSTFRNIW